MTAVLLINGSYRAGGVTDQIAETMANALQGAGAQVEMVFLRDWPIGFCKNCRSCTLRHGEGPGPCDQKDGMSRLIEKIETSNGFILAAPTNFGSATAVFKRFLERLVCYAYWPWAMAAPKYRKKSAPKKKAVLVSSCAAPGIFGRLLYNTRKDLAAAAKTMGARPVGTLFPGLVAGKSDYRLSDRAKEKARKLGLKLL
jgi:multimeric flavodoxin WrbA